MSKKKNKTTRAGGTVKPAGVQNASHDKTALKKAAVLGTGKKNSRHLPAMIVCAALIMGITYYLIPSGSKAPLAVSSQTPSNAPTSQVTYLVNLFDDGNARYFQYEDGDITVKYFILKSSDGIIRAAFDACDVCWPAGKGYYQDGDYMVCRNCGRRFASVLVNVVKGGCNPAPLNRNIENGNIVIQVDEILKGKMYFDYTKRT